jgi:UDPglucose 6-dehydrogenase
MEKKMNVGILGYGIVGKAIERGFRDKCRILVYDPLHVGRPDIDPPSLSMGNGTTFCENIVDVVNSCQIVFVCVPTPAQKEFQKIDGSIAPFDSSIIDSVMEKVNLGNLCVLSTHNLEDKSLPIIVIESAVVPRKIKEYLGRYLHLRLVVSPEFLTAKESFYRFLNPDCRILGGKKEDCEEVQKIFEDYSSCKPCKVGYCDAIGASLIKYMENSFLALKVSFMNQFYDLLKETGSATEWSHLAEIFHYDTRMGNSHYQVPGHDGDRGWGGPCWVKDINAIVDEARTYCCDLSLMKEVWKYNVGMRKKLWPDKE